jgi:peptide/nickel transport system permease protein
VIEVIVRRLAFAVVVMAAVSLITFAILAAGSDPARMLAGPQASSEAVERLRAQLGLDQPFWGQYAAYIGRVLEGDFGRSIVTGRPVLQELASRAAATFELMLAALAVTITIGVPLGVWAARRKDEWPDHLVRAIAVSGISVPGFWLGMLLVVVFYRDLGWFPSGGRFSGEPPPGPTGFYLVDSLLHGDLSAFAIAAQHLALPVMALAVAEIGATARLVRGQLIGVLAEDYIRVARAGGLSEAQVVRHHALRNALTPLLTVLGLSIAQMLYGSVVVETVFGWPGTGNYVVASIFALDFPVILGFALIASLVYVVVNALVDTAYAVLDPRVRSPA